MISKKNKELFTDFALFGTGIGLISSINVDGSGNPHVDVAKGVSTALPITGTLIGFKLILDTTKKFTKKNNDMFDFNL